MNKKSLILSGAIGLSLVSMASAVPQYVYITGSTAARNSAVLAITDQFDGVGVATTIVDQGQPIASYQKASFQLISGHLAGTGAGVVTTVKCHWSGSEAGIADLVGGSETFLDDAAPQDNAATPGPFISSPVDMAMADNDKAFSKNPGASITGSFVGIVPFKWVKEKGSVAGITGITAPQAIVLLKGGTKAALLTGNSTDTTRVYVSGRDSFSGTRVNTLGETGFGIFANPNQCKIASDGSMIDVDGSGTYVGFDIPDTSLYGYNSGGSLAAQMGFDLTQATSIDQVQGSGHFSIVAYLGFSDAGTGIANGGTELTYNGVTESTSAIQEGLYTFWGNEFLYRKNTVSSQATTLFTALINNTTGINHRADGTSFIDLTTMHASRNGPLSPPTHK